MIVIAKNVMLWIHLLSMIGAFGVLLGAQLCTPPADAGQPRKDRQGKVAAVLMAAGLLAGLVALSLKVKALEGEMPEHLMSTISMKFLLLLAAGAATGIASRKFSLGKAAAASGLRWVAIVALAAAALLGICL